MNEQELRLVVDSVIRALEERGHLKGCQGCEKREGCANPCRTPAAAPPRPGAVTVLPDSKGTPSGGIRVTVGTAGKVFSGGEWAPRKVQSTAQGPLTYSFPGTPSERTGIPVGNPTGVPPISPWGRDAEDGHTSASGCPHCLPLGQVGSAQLKELGADRIASCDPTQQCSAVSPYVDHTLLKPNGTQEEVGKLCSEARSFSFASVCVNPSYVAFCSRMLQGSGVKVCTVVGFPLGSTTPTVKAIEARDAIANGADEIDMVINVGALKSGNDAFVREDIRAVREATRGRVLKVILETSMLTDAEKVRACRMAKEVGADFVKTSTGFGGGGATVDDIRLMRETVGPLMGVKASGGIRDCATAQAMISAGATRLGTSASVAIVTDAASKGTPSSERGSPPFAQGAGDKKSPGAKAY